MSITLGMLATRYAQAAQKVRPATDQQLRGLAQVGVGFMKSEIQAVHAVDTGTMLNSVQAEQSGRDAYLIGPTTHYAPYVALGTSRMIGRPFHIYAARRLQATIKSGTILRDLGI